MNVAGLTAIETQVPGPLVSKVLSCRACPLSSTSVSVDPPTVVMAREGIRLLESVSVPTGAVAVDCCQAAGTADHAGNDHGISIAIDDGREGRIVGRDDRPRVAQAVRQRKAAGCLQGAGAAEGERPGIEAQGPVGADLQRPTSQRIVPPV